MRVIKPSVEIITPDNPLGHIEKCGRVCYKSESRITPGSSEKFCKAIIARGHEAVLEHYVFLFEMGSKVFDGLQYTVKQLEIHEGWRSFLRFTRDPSTMRRLVSGNVRAWRDFMAHCVKAYSRLPGYMYAFVEENPVLFPEYQGEGYFAEKNSKGLFRPVSAESLTAPLEVLVHCNLTLKFTCDRGVSHEIVRHRPASYCQESTRYCNYSSGDFGDEITVIEPMFLVPGTPPYHVWLMAGNRAEASYFALLDSGCTPQEARAVLPNSLKTEVVMTAPVQEWLHFFNLRCSTAAHPQMREVALLGQALMEQVLPTSITDPEEGGV